MTKRSESGALDFQSAIDIKITGLVAVFVNPERTECKVGLLRRTPMGHEHKRKVHTKEIDDANATVKEHQGDIGAKHVLTLNVPQGISLRKEDIAIERMVRPPDSDPSSDSFKWFADLEGPEFYDRPIGARESGFYPFITLDSGELFTDKISETILQKKGPRDTDYHDFGYVAVRIGIRIPLDQPGVEATLTNGYQTVFKSRPDRRYEIEIDRGPMHQPIGTVSDAETYYEDKAIGGELQDSEKIHFRSHADEHRAGPEAACFVAYMGQSPPG
ncbi:MAG: hypothetical protein M3362_11285 [Acidobacteriota bacterium]|nr:hypothetical protein [Acidobacteriota bacterium]